MLKLTYDFQTLLTLVLQPHKNALISRFFFLLLSNIINDLCELKKRFGAFFRRVPHFLDDRSLRSFFSFLTSMKQLK